MAVLLSRYGTIDMELRVLEEALAEFASGWTPTSSRRLNVYATMIESGRWRSGRLRLSGCQRGGFSTRADDLAAFVAAADERDRHEGRARRTARHRPRRQPRLSAGCAARLIRVG
jgi:hypothetical protein